MESNSDDVTARLKKTLDSRQAPALSTDLVTGAADRPAPHIVHPARRALTAGGLTFAVAAITVGALVVALPSQQGPLFTAAAASSSTGGAADSALAAPGGDSRLMMWVNYQYVAGPSLSTQNGSGHVYKLERRGTSDETLRNAAAQFGLTGDPAKTSYFDKAYPSYVIGKEDGTAPSVVVSWYGTGDWWYNDPNAYPQYSTCDTAPSTGSSSSDGTTGGDDPLPVDPPVCVVTPPSPNLAPSKADAQALAQKIFAATGLDVAASDIRVSADEWQTTATANLVVDGTETALEWGVGWSSTGEISYAYGHSVNVVDKGSYGTVSAKDAVARLADWRWYGAAGPKYQSGVNILAQDSMRSGVAVGGAAAAPLETPATEPTDQPTADPTEEPTAVPTETPTEEPTAVPTDAPTDQPTAEPVPTETPLPEPTPETVVVTVEKAHSTLLMMWDSTGDAWLVPGFAMPTQEGWFNTVVSLVDGVIVLPTPMPIEPYTTDSTTTDGTSNDGGSSTTVEP